MSLPVSLAQFATSGQFHAGLPDTVHRGVGMTPRCLHIVTVWRWTPRRWAMSSEPTGSQSAAFTGRIVSCNARLDNPVTSGVTLGP